MFIRLSNQRKYSFVKLFSIYSLNSILVTNNKKEFRRIPELKIEDWVHG
jgi:hypothetical protein